LRDTEVPIRAAALRGFAALVSALGGSGPEILAAEGVDEDQIARLDTFVTVSLLERLLEGAASELGVPDFGLRMAAQQELHFLGPVAIAMENSQTIGAAVECAERYLFVHSPAMSLEPIDDPAGDPEVIGLRYQVSTANVSPQLTDYGFGIVHRVMVLINGAAPYGLRSVDLPHPRLASEAVYTDFFGAQVRFDATSAVLRVPRRLLSAPVRGGNELLRDIAIDYLETHFGHKQLPVSDVVAEIVAGNIAYETPDLAKVARLLNLHPRSLQRTLSKEGRTFNEIVDDVRQTQTLTLITKTDLPFSQIAARVGMREQSSLGRAVHRWFNTSPSRLRSAAANPSE
jgi:AraC-like DNA-binding protein